MSVSGIERHAGMNHNTILSLLKVAGRRCEKLLPTRIQNIPCEDVQCESGVLYKRRKPTNGRGKLMTIKLVMRIVSLRLNETSSSYLHIAWAVSRMLIPTNSPKRYVGRPLRNDTN